MKKVYIITYHCAYNVGAMLQCYALSRVIKEIGNEVSIIDFRPPKIMNLAIEKELNRNLFSKVKNEINSLAHLIYRFLKYFPKRDERNYIVKDSTAKRFSKFMELYLPLTSTTYYKEDELAAFEQEDAIFITGSDQVWNPELSETPGAYLLDFVKKGQKNSYAASFGQKTVDAFYATKLNENLSAYNIISVREKSGIDILKNIIDKNVDWVLDPVFLISKNEWEKIVYSPKVTYPYIFLYRMESNPQFAVEIGKLKTMNPNLRVLQFDDINDKLESDYIIPQNGPLDFISYIRDSEYILTNSFHGTAFSIIFGKVASIVPHTKYNERISSLMDMIKISLENGVYNLPCDSAKRITQNRDKSINVLRKICASK